MLYFVVIWLRCSLSLKFQPGICGPPPPPQSWAAEQWQSFLSPSIGPMTGSCCMKHARSLCNIPIPFSDLTTVYIEGDAFRMFWMFGTRHCSPLPVYRDQRNLSIRDERGWTHQPLAVTFVRDVFVTHDSNLPGGGEENHLENTLNKTETFWKRENKKGK